MAGITKVLLAALLLGSFAACSDDDAADATTTTTEADEVTTTSEEEPATEELAPATFAVPFTLELPSDWSNPSLGPPNIYVVIAPPDSGSEYTTAVEFMIPAAATAQEVVDEIVQGGGGNYVISEPTEATVGNMPATQIDVELANGTSGGFSLINLAEEGVWSLFDGNRGRLYVVDVEGTPVVVAVEAPTGEYDAFLTQAEEVLATVAF